jgi:hypothetical protein
MAMMSKETSRKVGKLASALLKKKAAPKAVKSVAGSALAQRESKASRLKAALKRRRAKK